MMNIREFATLTGVSVRTLHHYHSIGLLPPDKIEINGYRVYGEQALARMQQILLYRELDFPLHVIQDILAAPDYDKREALAHQKQLLLLKRERLNNIITMLDCMEKGETIMNYNAFDNKKIDAYKQEVKQRWGHTAAYKEYAQKVNASTPAEQNSMADGLNEIFSAFAQLKNKRCSPADPAATDLAKQLQDFITRTQYTCTDEILLCLGEMYVADQRFRATIDRHGEGTASFVRDVIQEHCKAH